jgi:hypothetical protein
MLVRPLPAHGKLEGWFSPRSLIFFQSQDPVLSSQEHGQ